MSAGAAELRPIRPGDDAAVARVIRTVMPELGAGGPGFAIHDPEVDFMSRVYARPGCAYFVAVVDGRVVGGGGVAPLEGGARDTCELRKMYLLAEARGGGVGRGLLVRCLQAARELGYRRCYLETLATMAAARRLYQRAGFTPLAGPLGRTGHFGCNTFYALDLCGAPGVVLG